MESEGNIVFTSSSCALCGYSWDNLEHSPEHIIPESIGGRKTVLGFICKSCNNESGGTWDNELSSQLQSFSALLGVKRHKGKKPFFDFETEEGEPVRLEADGTLSFTGKSKVIESIDHKKGKGEVSIRARTHEQAEEIVQSLQAKYIKQGAKTMEFSKQENFENLNQAIQINTSFGGELAGKSLVKSVWALAVYNKLAPFECEKAHDYVVKDGKPCFGYYYSADLLNDRPSDIIHCVSIRGDPSKGLLLGYVEYFSVLRVVVCLSTSYTGSKLNSTYALNPTNGETFEIGVNLDFEISDIERIYDYMHYDASEFKNCLAHVLLLSYKRSVKLNFKRQVDKVAKDVCFEYGFDEDQNLTDEEYKTFYDRFIELIMPFYVQEMASQREIQIAENWSDETKRE